MMMMMMSHQYPHNSLSACFNNRRKQQSVKPNLNRLMQILIPACYLTFKRIFSWIEF